MTRAQAALVSNGFRPVLSPETLMIAPYKVLTHAKSRMQGGQEQDRTLSPFIVDAQRQTPVSVHLCATFDDEDNWLTDSDQVMFASTAPDVSASDRDLFATLLGRTPVSAGDAAIAIQV